MIRSQRHSSLTLIISVFGLATIHAADPIVFRDATDEAGLRVPLAGLLGHGAAVGDFDGDGRTDIYMGGFCDRPISEYAPADGPVENKLLRNVGDGTFVVVDQPALQQPGRTSGAVFADLDNNGTLELFVANNTRDRTRGDDQRIHAAKLQLSQLFRNDAGKMIDITSQSHVLPDNLLSVRNVGVFDYDRDGLLDLFIVEDKFRRGGGRSRLLRNTGGLQFQDRSQDAGLADDIHGLGLAIADVNQDGWPDIFVPHSNRMLISLGGGNYHEPESLRETFTWDPLDGEDWPCGAAFADLNRDGWMDLVVSIHSVVARNRVYINRTTADGTVAFVDVTTDVGLGESVPVRCPHVEVQDFNNDSLPDIYVSAAWKDADGKIEPLIYVNQGIFDGLPRFQAPRASFDDSMVYFPAGPSADFDNDGRLDLLLVNWFQENHSRILMNQGNKGNWLQIRVQGKTVNRMGIGSRIEIYAAGKIGQPDSLLAVQEVATGFGYASGQVAQCHFGLGDARQVDICITLPGGNQILRESVSANQRLVIQEP